MYLSIYIVSIYIYIYFIDFYVIFNEKSKKMKKMRVCVRECGGAPPVFVDDLFCKLLYQDYTHHSTPAGQHPDPEHTKLKHRQGKKISEIIRHPFLKNVLSTYICILIV